MSHPIIKNLRTVVDGTDTFWGKAFDWGVQFLILLSVVMLSAETMPSISDSTRNVLAIMEVVCVGLFTAELILRIIVSEKGWRYLFSFFGVIDVLAIIPFYLGLAIDLRGIRVIRIFRVFRLLKLTRYSDAIRHFRDAFASIRAEMVLFGISAFVIVFISSVGIYYFEHEAQPDTFTSIPAALWWSMATLTTVGYGDVYPITSGGRIFTSLILVAGLAIVAIPSGLMASALTSAAKKTSKGETEHGEL